MIHGARVLGVESEESLVRASPKVLCCAIEQSTLSSSKPEAIGEG